MEEEIRYNEERRKAPWWKICAVCAGVFIVILILFRYFLWENIKSYFGF